MGIGHGRQSDRGRGNGWENTGIDNMNPLQAKRTPQQVRADFPFPRPESHGKTSATVKTSSRRLDPEKGQHGNEARLPGMPGQLGHDRADYPPGPWIGKRGDFDPLRAIVSRRQ